MEKGASDHFGFGMIYVIVFVFAPDADGEDKTFISSDNVHSGLEGF